MLNGSGENEGSDAAAAAFDRIRGEMAVFRRVIESVAAERAGIEVPDYTATLAQMAAGLDKVSDRIVTLASRPALQHTPETLALSIAQAGVDARRADHAALTKVFTVLDDTVHELRNWVPSALEARRQNLMVFAAFVGGVVVATIVWAALSFAVIRMALTNGHRHEEPAAAGQSGGRETIVRRTG